MLKKIWKFLKRIVLGRDLVIYRLRKYLRKLYEGYPTHSFYNYDLTYEIKTGITRLENDKIIKSTGKHFGVKMHRLLPKGIRLVELWNMERLTIILLILVLLQILLSINLKFFF